MGADFGAIGVPDRATRIPDRPAEVASIAGRMDIATAARLRSNGQPGKAADSGQNSGGAESGTAGN